MRVYLACPYTHPDPKVRLERFEAVNRVAGRLIEAGFHAFSPISMTHPIALACGLEGDSEYWKPFNHAFIDVCDELLVLRIDGWKESEGVIGEIVYALSQSKQVSPVPELYTKEM